MKFNECNYVLPDLYDDLDCAKKGRFNPYLQGMMQRECSGVELSREEQAQVRRIQVVLQNVPQWSDCKNRRPNPICTVFEHRFHALKPHLVF